MILPQNLAEPQPPVPTITAQAPEQELPIIPSTLWASLAPPDQNASALLSSQLPQINPSDVRTLTFEDADAIFSLAAARQETILELFTNPSWTGKNIYYVNGPDVAAIMSKYSTGSLVPAEGTDTAGTPYHMLAMVIGGGKLFMVMDRNDFHYRNPAFPSNTFIAKSLVAWTIAAPGKLDISGITVVHFLVNPTIESVTQISPTQARVDTNWGSKNVTIHSISIQSAKLRAQAEPPQTLAQIPTLSLP
ncbi:MAG: hypothetical protein ACYCPQ_00195 [Elusimicrobiota bacterium]